MVSNHQIQLELITFLAVCISVQELQGDMDSLHLEIRRKESNLDYVSQEKERLDGKLRLLDGKSLS